MALIEFLIYSLLMFNQVLGRHNDFCQLSCGNVENTVCSRRHERCGAGPACGHNFRQIQVDRDYVTHLHNHYRNKVATGNEKRNNQPSAANMKVLSYNSDLEYVAQCWTNTCTFRHDQCRRISKFEYVGQNLAIVSTTNPNANVTSIVTSMIRDFYDEVKYFNPKNIHSFSSHGGPAVGHYTQMVWADTKEVGCGMTFYTSGNWNNFLLACNYGPGGNIIGTPVYKVGKPASQCSGARSNTYHGLCSH